MELSDKRKQAAEILKDHFPEVEWTEELLERESWYLGSLLTAGGFVDIAYLKDQERALSSIQKAVEDLGKSMMALHPSITRAATNMSFDTAVRLFVALTGRAPSSNLEFLVNELPGPESDLEKMWAALEGLQDMHHHQRDHSLPAKIHLVHQARLLWEHYNNETPALAPTERDPFIRLVEDLIRHAGKTWGIERVLEKYREHKKGGGKLEEWPKRPLVGRVSLQTEPTRLD